MKRIFALSSVIMMLVMFNTLAAQTKIISSKHSNVTRIEQSNKSETFNFTQQDKDDSHSEKSNSIISVIEKVVQEDKPVAVKKQKDKASKTKYTQSDRNARDESDYADDEDYEQPVIKPVKDNNRQTQSSQRDRFYSDEKPVKIPDYYQRSTTSGNKVPSLSDNRNRAQVDKIKTPQTNKISPVQTVRSKPVRINNDRSTKPADQRSSNPVIVKTTQSNRSSSTPSTNAIVNKITRSAPVAVVTEYTQSTLLIKHTSATNPVQPSQDTIIPTNHDNSANPPYSYWDSGHNGSSWDDNHHGNNLDNDHQNNNWDNDHHDNHWNDHDGNWNNHHDHNWNDHHGYWGGYYSYHEWRRHHTYYDFAAPFYVWSYWNDYYTYSYIHHVYYSPWHQVHYAYVQPGFCFNFYWNNEVKKIRGLVVRNDWFEQNNDDNIDIDYSPYLSAGVHVHSNNCPRNGYGIIYQKSNGEYAFLHFDAYGNRIAKKMFENNRHNRKIYVEARGYKDSYNHKFRVLSMNRIKWHENVIFSFGFHNGWIFGRTA